MRAEVENIIQLLDRETMAHCIGMKNMAIDIENNMKTGNQLLSQAALLCDTGKLYVSNYLLEKQTPLTEYEMHLINNHPIYSYELIKGIDMSEEIKSLVLYHHGKKVNYENLTPYYTELKEYYTTLRTIDAYLGLTEYRTYRYAMCSPREAYEILEKEASHNRDVLDFIKNNYIY